MSQKTGAQTRALPDKDEHREDAPGSNPQKTGKEVNGQRQKSRIAWYLHGQPC
jgi:hypothetical protein